MKPPYDICDKCMVELFTWLGAFHSEAVVEQAKSAQPAKPGEANPS